ncbi:MAG: carbon monoxide dehydrogenase subunit G [Thaumarchaeota archaeon]|nr:carbon monoxide dehydrogenase subunit G [Nitrososphaerota archaeon]
MAKPMKYEGTFTVKVPPERVFNFLLDANAIGKCLPDVQSIEVQGPDKFRAKVKTGISFIRGIFDFQFTVAEKTPHTYAKLVAHGTGTGSAIDLDTRFDLKPTSDGGTEMKWMADAKVSGLIAGVGSRLMDSAAGKIISQLFDSIKKELEK